MGTRAESPIVQHAVNMKPVLIIGSGCTGLAIAQGLKQASIPYILFERSPRLHSPGDRDWNMGLHWSYPTLQSLLPSLPTHIQSLQVDPNTPTLPVDTLSFLNGATGQILAQPKIEYFYRLRRSKLRALLSSNLNIRYNKKLKDVKFKDAGEGGVEVLFEDGETVEGSMVVAADGARSTVRSLLLPFEHAKPTRLPYAATFIQARYTSSQALFLRSFHPLYLAAPHPSGLFAFFGLQDAPKVEEPEGWSFFFYISWPCTIEQQDEERAAGWGDKERIQQVKEKAKGYCEPWKSACEWLGDGNRAFYVPLSVWDPSLPEHSWDNMDGRVTLVGDAAHPMTFQRGQGLNHSITSAGSLVSYLIRSSAGELTQAEAINAYEKEMKSRAGEEVRVSVLNTTMLHDWSKVLESPVFKSGLNAGKKTS